MPTEALNDAPDLAEVFGLYLNNRSGAELGNNAGSLFEDVADLGEACTANGPLAPKPKPHMLCFKVNMQRKQAKRLKTPTSMVRQDHVAIMVYEAIDQSK